jgi:uncharacterized protein YaiI (UPF0178 family)
MEKLQVFAILDGYRGIDVSVLIRGKLVKILVDADACPKSVFHICMKVGHQYGIRVWTVASFNHSIDSDHHIVVGNDSEETDIKIINVTESGDVVVTQDWGLAAMVLGKGARCLGPKGREFRSERIGFLLEEREIKNRLRRGGGRTKGPKKRTSEDDRRFEACLKRILLESSETLKFIKDQQSA